MLKLIVRGPLDYDDSEFVIQKLDSLTRRAKDITLIDDKRIGKDFSRSPSSFPLAEQWFRLKWLRNVRNGNPQYLFSETKRFYNPGGKNAFTKGQKKRRLAMIKAANALVAFHDVGGTDIETEAMIELAHKFNLPTRIIRI